MHSDRLLPEKKKLVQEIHYSNILSFLKRIVLSQINDHSKTTKNNFAYRPIQIMHKKYGFSDIEFPNNK